MGYCAQRFLKVMFPAIGRLFVGGLFPFFFLLLGQIIDDDTADDIDGQPGGGIDVFDGYMAVFKTVYGKMGDAGQWCIRCPTGNGHNPCAQGGSIFGSGEQFRGLSGQTENNDQLLIFHAAGYILHNGWVGIGKDIKALQLELQGKFIRNVFGKAARQKINALCLPDFPDYGENGFYAQLFDGLSYFSQAFVENFIDGDIVLVDGGLLRDEIAQLGKAGNPTFFDGSADRCR